LWQLKATCVLLVGVGLRVAVAQPLAPADAPYARQQRYALGVPVVLAFAVQLFDRMYIQNRHHYRLAAIRSFPGHFAAISSRLLLFAGSIAACELPLQPVYGVGMHATIAVFQLVLLHAQKFACTISSEAEHPLDAPLNRALDGLRLKALRHRERAAKSAEAAAASAATAIQSRARGSIGRQRWMRQSKEDSSHSTPPASPTRVAPSTELATPAPTAQPAPSAPPPSDEHAAPTRATRWMRQSREAPATPPKDEHAPPGRATRWMRQSRESPYYHPLAPPSEGPKPH